MKTESVFHITLASDDANNYDCSIKAVEGEVLNSVKISDGSNSVTIDTVFDGVVETSDDSEVLAAVVGDYVSEQLGIDM